MHDTCSRRKECNEILISVTIDGRELKCSFIWETCILTTNRFNGYALAVIDDQQWIQWNENMKKNFSWISSIWILYVFVCAVVVRF